MTQQPGNPAPWSEWDEDPIGYTGAMQRRWKRGRHQYAAFMLAVVGCILLIGVSGFFSAPRLVGALSVVGAAISISLADRKDDARVERALILIAAALFAAGVALFALA